MCSLICNHTARNRNKSKTLPRVVTQLQYNHLKINIMNNILLFVVVLWFSFVECSSIEDGGVGEHDLCQRDMFALLMQVYPNAQEMFFMATGKNLPSDMGDFDLCERLPNAHYCYVRYTLAMPAPESDDASKSSSSFSPGPIPISQVTWGLCIPKPNCTFDDMSVVLNTILMSMKMEAIDIDGYCYDEKVETSWDWKNYLTAIFAGSLVVLVVLGTLIEAGWEKINRWREGGSKDIVKFLDVYPVVKMRLKVDDDEQTGGDANEGRERDLSINADDASLLTKKDGDLPSPVTADFDEAKMFAGCEDGEDGEETVDDMDKKVASIENAAPNLDGEEGEEGEEENDDLTPLISSSLSSSSSPLKDITEVEDKKERKPRKFLSRPRNVLDYLLYFPSCFSAITNTRRLLAPAPQESLDFLNGIRFFSMCWVIMGHTVLLNMSTPGYKDILNVFDPKHGAAHHWPFQLILAAEFSVDSFFFLSAFLLAYLAFNNFPKRKKLKGPFKWLPLPIITYYFHRILRIWPNIAFVMLFMQQVLIFAGNGPLWPGIQSNLHDTCGKYWYSTLFFFQNFYPKFSKGCMGQLWFMSNDMQMHWISYPFFFLPYLLPIIGDALLVLCGLAFLVASWITTAILAHRFNTDNYLFTETKDSQDDDAHTQDGIYVKPYTRLSPFVVGFLTAWALWRIERLYAKRKWEKKLPFYVRMLGYSITLILFSIMTWIPLSNYSVHHSDSWNSAENILYATFSRFVWTVGLSIMVFIFAFHGPQFYSGIEKACRSFLGWSAWTPLARLTFGAYVTHIYVIMIVNGNARGLFNYRWIELGYYFSM